MNIITKLLIATTMLTLVVVTFGAHVRLTHAGLGCPDWPGCYGTLTVPRTVEAIYAANADYPSRPVEAGKAWREMTHRSHPASLGKTGCYRLAWLDHSPGRPWDVDSDASAETCSCHCPPHRRHGHSIYSDFSRWLDKYKYQLRRARVPPATTL